MSPPAHNLNLQEYSLDEILDLFDLHDYNFSIEDLKKAKRKVVMLHPDKSKLDAKYFLFYKKAFDVIIQFYDNQNKQNRNVDSKNLAYDPNYSELNKGTSKQITQTVQDMKSEAFQEKFNELFENNHMGNQPDPTRNEWFTQQKSEFDIPGGKISSQMMNEQFQTIKQQSNGLIQYNGVQTINQDHATNNNLYQDQDDSNSYVSSDPFGKLKFDDLRKVHRDQSVLAVSENDIHNMQTYRTVEEFNQARSQHSYDPMEKQHADKLLQEQEQAMRNKMMQKEYRAKLELEQNEAKNKAVLSSFLMLQNKK
jgi:hypothetical protein|tara:strand:+ start:918 stop:1844 length:927 start_codon:yes stop_codon:yes gene_type:complete